MLRSLALACVFVLSAAPAASGQIVSFCWGDGTTPTACPCQNSGSQARGCQNSTGSGGAGLTVAGTVSPDTITFTVTGEPASVLSVLLQADSRSGGALFGDGVNCLAGNTRRLFWKQASGGTVTFPGPGDPTISARSAALGDTIPHPNGFRYYQVQYRDKSTTFCPEPLGATWNISNAIMVTW